MLEETTNPAEPFASTHARLHFKLEPLETFWRSAGKQTFPHLARIHDLNAGKEEAGGAIFASLEDLPILKEING